MECGSYLLEGECRGPVCEFKEEEMLDEQVNKITNETREAETKDCLVMSFKERVVNSVKYSTTEISKRMCLEMDFGMVLYISKSTPPIPLLILF